MSNRDSMAPNGFSEPSQPYVDNLNSHHLEVLSVIEPLGNKIDNSGHSK
jgi:hypothetical protein